MSTCPHRQRSSGLAALLVGDVDHARDQALANLRVLANAVRDGYTVVCSEPTAALMLREEYVKLTEDLDAELVAANTMDVGQYLLGLDARGQLPRPRAPLARPRRLSPTVSSSRLQRRQSGSRAVAQRSGAGRRIHQPRLLGHGGHLRPGSRSVPDVASRRSRTAQAASRRRYRDRRHRMRPMPDPDGARNHQAHAPSHQALEHGLWSQSRRCGNTSRTPSRVSVILSDVRRRMVFRRT